MKISKTNSPFLMVNERNSGITIFVILVPYVSYVWIQRDIDKKEVLSNHQYTTGIIVGYSIISSSRNHHMDYKYVVDEVESIFTVHYGFTNNYANAF